MDLFRKEVLEHKKTSMLGDIILLRPMSFYILTGMAVFFSFCLILLIVFGKYAEKKTVTGFLTPSAGLVKIFSPKPGTVMEVKVKEGELVAKEQILLTVDTRRSTNDSVSVDTGVLQQLEHEIQEQEQILNNLEYKYKELQQQLHEKKELLQADLVILSKEIEQKKEVVESNRISDLDNKKLVERGIISQRAYQHQHSEYAVREGDLLRSQRERNSKLEELQRIKYELNHLPINKQDERARINSSLAELKQRKLDREGSRSSTILSPIAGKVSALQAEVGMYDRGGEVPLLTILPEGSDLRAEVYVPTSAIGFIKPGQKVRIRYQAFPYEKYGIQEGEVLEVSKTILIPREMVNPILNLSEPVYKLTVKLAKQSIRANGEDRALQAGMLLEADIVLQETTFFSRWVLEPLRAFESGT